MIVLLLISVCILGDTLKSKGLPKFNSFLPLLRDNHLSIGSLIFNQKISMVSCLFQVGVFVGRGDFFTKPDESFVLCLDCSGAARVQTEISVATLVHILSQKFAHNALRVVFLMTHQDIGSWVDSERPKVGVLKSFFEPHQLLDKLHVWIDTSTAILCSLMSLHISDSFSEHHVSTADGG